MNTLLDLNHVPGRIRIIPIPEWPGFWHWGIEAWECDEYGEPMMWHSPKGGRVSCTTFAEFARGQASEFVWTPETPDQAISVLDRISSIEGMPWNLTKANCEQVVRWAVEGQARSKQLGNVLGGAFVAAGVLALLAAGFSGQPRRKTRNRKTRRRRTSR